MQASFESTAPIRPFVGRVPERAELADAMAGVARGRGRVCLLAGEPGIGKTRLCDQASHEAAGLDMRVLWGRCWEAGGAPSYWPWLDVLDALARGLDDAQLASALGDGAATFVELVPSVRARVAGAAAGARALGMRSGDEARFALYRSVLGLLRAASEARATLIVLDDLHAADEASLQLLRFVAREVRGLRVLLLATYRDVDARWTEHCRRVLALLSREGTTLQLRPLSAHETEAWLSAQARELPADVRAKIAARAQGHPLFLEELLRALGGDQAGAALPHSVRELIRDRLAHVSSDVRRVLDLAAAAGDAIDPELLAAAARTSAGELQRALAAARDAGIVCAQGPSAYRFAHALIREALELELSGAAGAALHAEVARALSARAGEPPHAELAHHSLLAGDLAAAVAHATRAAERAMALFAHDEAVALLRRVLDAIEATPEGSDAEHARLIAMAQVALARAHMRRGDYPEARGLCARAAERARALGDAELLAQAALARGLDITAALVDADLVAMLQSALDALPRGDSPLRVRISARMAAAMQPAPDLMRPIGVAREAIASARRIGDRATLLEALYTGMAAMMDIVDPRERMPLNLEVEKLAAEAGDRERLLRTQGRLVFDHMELGELGAADARIDSFERIATEAGARRYLWRVPLFRAMRAMMHGQFDEAELQFERARVLGHAAGDPHTERTCVLQREGLLRAAERHDAMIAYEPEARRVRAALYSGAHWQNGGSAFTYSRLEDAASAARYLSLVPQDDWPLVHNPPAFAHLGEPLAMCGQPHAVEHVYTLLLPAAERFVSWGYTGFVWDGPATRVLGILAARLGREEESDAHFAHALAALERLDALPYLARTSYEHGRALLERDPAAARAALERAHALAEQLGMLGLLRLCDARLRALAARTSPRAPQESAPPPARKEPLALAPEGELWAIAFAGQTLRLRDSLGMQYLARLIAAPGQPIHALELAQAKLAPDAALSSALHTSDAGEALDATAREQYRARVQALREELEDAEAARDAERAERTRDELTFLAAELSRAVGLGGRTRRAGSAAERARTAVQRRIKSALDKIEEASPALRAFLESTIRTGTYCEYRPELAR
jgi:hypothetical protein